MVAIRVDRAHPAWKQGSIASILLMEIKAAFPTVGRGRLIIPFRGRRMDRDLRQWMASCLSD